MKWLALPADVLALRNPRMEESWIDRENYICRRLVFYSSLILAGALLLFLPLDAMRSQFDLSFALMHRMGGMVLFLGLALAIRMDVFKKWPYGFAFYKILFMCGALYITFFQVLLMFSKSDVPRIYVPIVLVGTVGILNMGLRSSLSFSIVHTLILLAVGLYNWEVWTQERLFISDLSLQVMSIILVYILSSRYRLAVQLHISNFIREEAALNRADHAYNQLTKLVLPHVVTKINAGFHIEDTMPVGRDEAFVICFDIVGSSQIEHQDYYRRLEMFQAQCFEAMNANYDPETLEGEAYRIKELGDGFLCSVGFPLKAPHQENPAVLSHRLAQRFLQIFDQAMAGLEDHRPILAGIGIAYGPIEGYFPSSGPRQYDLRDRSIVLATRYQELRKAILVQETLTQHAIVISRAVYQQLPETLQQSYKRIVLQDIRVRDDHSAEDVFVTLMSPLPAATEKTAA